MATGVLSGATVSFSAGTITFPSGDTADFPATAVRIIDNAGGEHDGRCGDGHYTVSAESSGRFVVTYGRPPLNSKTLLNLCHVYVVCGTIQKLFEFKSRPAASVSLQEKSE